MNDKIWAFVIAGIICIVAMALKVPGAEQLCYAVVGGMFGSSTGQNMTAKETK